jgi:MATE family multidrug resistance protein
MRLQHTRAIVRLSWPILVAQLAILASGVADTVMTGHYGATHLAAIGIGAGIWITVFITLMGVLLGLSPLIARHFGAGELEAIGEQVRQGMCLALALSLLGVALLSFPRPLLEVMQVPLEVADIATRYLRAIAWGLPAALLVRVFYGLTPAVGRPRPVMLINLIALFIKIPLSNALLRGLYGLPELGGVGCAVGSVAMFWTMVLLALLFVLFDPFYRRFHLLRGSFRPNWPVLIRSLEIGVPIGVAQFGLELQPRLGIDVSAPCRFAERRL